MIDPSMLAIATAAAAAIAGRSTEAMAGAMGSLAGRIRERFRGRPADEAVLEEAAADPDSAERREALAETLAREAEQDPEFGDELLDLARRAGVRMPAEGQAVNVVNARSVGKVIQTNRDINVGGDLIL